MNIEEEIKEQAKNLVESSELNEEVLHKLDFLIYAYFQDKELNNES